MSMFGSAISAIRSRVLRTSSSPILKLATGAIQVSDHPSPDTPLGPTGCDISAVCPDAGAPRRIERKQGRGSARVESDPHPLAVDEGLSDRLLERTLGRLKRNHRKRPGGFPHDERPIAATLRPQQLDRAVCQIIVDVGRAKDVLAHQTRNPGSHLVVADGEQHVRQRLVGDGERLDRRQRDRLPAADAFGVRPNRDCPAWLASLNCATVPSESTL